MPSSCMLARGGSSPEMSHLVVKRVTLRCPRGGAYVDFHVCARSAIKLPRLAHCEAPRFGQCTIPEDRRASPCHGTRTRVMPQSRSRR
jgi:hypothetical protein